MARATRFVAGLGRAPGEAGGDPGPKTALGVFLGIKAAVKFRLGRSDLARRLGGRAGGGRRRLPPVRPARGRRRPAERRGRATRRTCSACVDEFRARAVPVEEVLFEDVDVLAPCALGAVLTTQSIPRLRARIVAGAANNQLAQGQDGEGLPAAGILYAPDYVINAGGIISVAREYRGGATEAQVIADIHGDPGAPHGDLRACPAREPHHQCGGRPDGARAPRPPAASGCVA